jgi:hypothetical protein
VYVCVCVGKYLVTVFTGDKTNSGTKAGDIGIVLVGESGPSGAPAVLSSFESSAPDGSDDSP